MRKLLLLLAVAITGTAITTTSSHVKADTTWHSGTPKVFHHHGYLWVSDLYHSKNAKYANAYYERDTTPLNAKAGVNITPSYYNQQKQYKMSGADTSAFASANPHYQNLGHGYYKIVAGATGKHSLYYEVHNSLWHMYGSMNLVKVYSPTKIKLWVYSKRHGELKPVDGTIFHRYPAKDVQHIIGWK